MQCAMCAPSDERREGRLKCVRVFALRARPETRFIRCKLNVFHARGGNRGPTPGSFSRFVCVQSDRPRNNTIRIR